MDLGITGSVYVEFTITESGSVANATVLKSLHPSLDAAAIEAAMALPDFAPATRGGKAFPCLSCESPALDQTTGYKRDW